MKFIFKASKRFKNRRSMHSIMKMRIGFVSNSSSTSFILWIPGNFKAKAFSAMALEKSKRDARSKAILKPLLESAFKKIKAGTLNSDKIHNIIKESGLKDADYKITMMVQEVLELTLIPFEIYSIDTGPDEGLYFNAASAKQRITSIESTFA